jgi:hypothetical protein
MPYAEFILPSLATGAAIGLIYRAGCAFFGNDM